MTTKHRFSAKGYRALCQGGQTTDAAHNRALRFVFTIILRAKSPSPSRYACVYSLKTLEIVAKESGVTRVFLLNMNFRETKFAGRREKQLSAKRVRRPNL